MGDDSFGAALAEGIRTLVPYDSILILAYPAESRPRLLFDGSHHALRQNKVETYIEAAYLLDPFFLKSGEVEDPVLWRMADIAPDDFVSSDYVTSWYASSNVCDEINLMARTGPDVVVAISLGRADGHDPFSRADQHRLEDVLPMVAALLAQHEPKTRDPGGARRGDEAHQRLEARLDSLGGDVLTAREQEVTRYILRGYSAQATADLLGLSAETVKVHRRNIYRKLGIGSVSELFSMALSLLIGGEGT